jgi:CotH kinase protein
LIKQCLGYQLFADAGIASPRCNYAQVVVNGEDLGVFSNIESVRAPVLARTFDDDDGSLWEGTLSDFRHGWTDTFDHKDGDDQRAPLDELADVLETTPDAGLLAALEPLVDVDAFLTFWAMEALIGHWDGYAGNTNNYFVYHDPDSGQLYFLPWGIDGTFHNGNPFGEELPTVVSANGMLAHRLYQLPDLREQYVARVKELLDTVWHEPDLVAEIDRMESLIVYAAYPGGFPEHAVYIEYLRQYVEERSGIVYGELYEGIPEWDVELRGNPCFVQIGQIHAELQTTWGTLDTVDPFVAGSGTMDITWDGWEVPVEFVGAVAGVDSAVADGSQAVVAGIAALPDDAMMVPYMVLPTAELVPGNVLGFDWIQTTALLGYAAPETGGEMVVAAYIGDGALELEQAGTNPGDPVVFTVDGALLTSGL